MKFHALERNGSIVMKPFTKAKLKDFCRENPGIRFEIVPITPESAKQRRFFEGAVIPLVTFYQEGMDHRNADDRHKVREWLKLEFNGEMVVVNNEVKLVSLTTKDKALRSFVDAVIDWLIENYAPPAEALDPEKYKHWRDTIFPFGGPETYIDYLVERNILK